MIRIIILAVITTIIVGAIGSAFGYDMNFESLGVILAVANMGGFILYSINKN